MNHLRLFVLGTLVMLGVFVACGNDVPPPTCTGTSCSCEPGKACDIGDSACSGGSCTLSCPMDSTCTGTCGQSCSINCASGADCDVTVGPSGSVSCAANSTCAVKCTGSCSVSCAGTSCSIQCAADSAPRPFEGTAQCQ